MSEQGRIVTGVEVLADREVDCDVCVVGSGSGGGWLAHELVKQGKRVVMLEEGGYFTRSDFNLTEAFAYPNLYQELGARGTDDRSMYILQGRSVGGGTTVNWCSSFRTPKRILDHWRDVHGVDTLSEAVLGPHWDVIEKRLRIAEWPLERINENNRALWDGLGALGYGRGLIRRNVNSCVNLGHCGHGCPIDAKQSTLVTVIPDAVERGLTVFANCSARRIEWSGRTVKAVHADVLDPTTDKPKGVRLTVRPKVLAVCGGAINSPALLLRSGLEADGRVGRRTLFHPVIASFALFDRDIRCHEGAPQSVYSHHFIDRGPGKLGFLFEVPPVHPMLGAGFSTLMGPALQDAFVDFNKVQAVIALTVDGLLPDEQAGTVRLRKDGYSRLSVRYDFGPANWEAFKAAVREAAKIQLAAGAKKVLALFVPPVVISSEAELAKLDAAPWEVGRMRIASAHQMGGCQMGKDPKTSVVDPSLRFHGLDNLFVVDGSVFPTALGVNPQLTIFGLARWAAAAVGAAVPG